MKLRILLQAYIIIVSCMVSIGTASASWAFPFVVYNENVYAISNNSIDLNQIQIGDNIGKVTAYSIQEGTYSGNFSNYYPIGTPYYEVIGTDVREVIAIKEDDRRYVTAIYYGKYAGSKHSELRSNLIYAIGTLVAATAVFWLLKRKKSLR